jgi:hypothetical protein
MAYKNKQDQLACARKHYRENKSDYINRVAKRRDSILHFIVGYLSWFPCIDCGEMDIRCLDFDHVSGKKSFSIGTVAARGRGFLSIVREFEKCVIRCSNCHRKKTHIKSKRFLFGGSVTGNTPDSESGKSRFDS